MTIETTLPQLNSALNVYIRAAGRGVMFGLVKQSQELSRNLAMEARGLMPEKGAVRAARLEAFKQGEGIRVGKTARKYADAKTVATASSVKQGMLQGGAIFMERTKRGVKKDGRNWWQIAVDRELNLRESGRGFLHHADKFDIMSDGERRLLRRIHKNSKSRYGPILGEFALTSDVSNGESGKAEFTWGGFSELSNSAVLAMGRTRGQAAMARAIVATVDNIVPYLERKLGEEAANAFRK